mmetsp:Transcript_39799/g.93262  ORF Transcript_39799/g.93262 Transcript_39799/m.93262 type:complete len:1002 (-) Transcript_39799:365-3370(-)
MLFFMVIGKMIVSLTPLKKNGDDTTKTKASQSSSFSKKPFAILPVTTPEDVDMEEENVVMGSLTSPSPLPAMYSSKIPPSKIMTNITPDLQQNFASCSKFHWQQNVFHGKKSIDAMLERLRPHQLRVLSNVAFQNVQRRVHQERLDILIKALQGERDAVIDWCHDQQRQRKCKKNSSGWNRRKRYEVRKGIGRRESTEGKVVTINRRLLPASLPIIPLKQIHGINQIDISKPKDSICIEDEETSLKSKNTNNDILPILYLEGIPAISQNHFQHYNSPAVPTTHPTGEMKSSFSKHNIRPLPRSTATLFIRQRFAAPDEIALASVPYIETINEEEHDTARNFEKKMSELFDCSGRSHALKHGPSYVEESKLEIVDMCLKEVIVKASLMGENVFEEQVQRAEKESCGKEDPIPAIFRELVSLVNLPRWKVEEQYHMLIEELNSYQEKRKKDNENQESKMVKDVGTTRGHTNKEIISPFPDIYTENGSMTCTAIKTSTKIANKMVPSKDGTKNVVSNSELQPRNSDITTEVRYEMVSDSFRTIFCRRCFKYDCNVHGNLDKPAPELQMALAMEKEYLDLEWAKSDKKLKDKASQLLQRYGAALFLDDNSTNHEKEVIDTFALNNDNASTPSNDNTSAPSKYNASIPSSYSASALLKYPELDPLQKSICDRVHNVCNGNVLAAADILGLPSSSVQHFISSRKLSPIQPRRTATGKAYCIEKKKKGYRHYSMKNYNPTWLKCIKENGHHVTFDPCDHGDEQCTEDNCSCVQRKIFCTKHCALGHRSRNFFRGCQCTHGNCSRQSCSCFAAGRECDPDLCACCGAGCDTDDVVSSPKQQINRGRNNNIGMRHNKMLLVAVSTFPAAGWGLFIRHAISKDEFIGEYIGELVSNEEADRRGQLYDRMNRSYLFDLTTDHVVDAARKGNKTRFINHSSRPNCYPKLLNVNGDARIGFFAKVDIEAQAELFFDYRYGIEVDDDMLYKPAYKFDWVEESSSTIVPSSSRKVK